MTNDAINAITYEAENHVVSSANGSSSGTYAYDGTGYRVEKTSGSTGTVYIFSGSKVIAEYDNGAAPISPTREYVYGGAALLAKIDSAGTKYYHQDHLSNRLVTDSSGNTLEQMGHYPFGYSWYNSTNDKLLFTSYERDAESGNDYAMARTYINRLGRFSSPDPIAGDISDPQSLNRYTYARNIPVSLIDPTGMMEEESCDDSEDDSCGGGGGGYGSDGGVASWFFGTSGSSTDTGTQPNCDASGNCVFSITTSEPGPLTNPYYGDPSQGGGDLIGACPGGPPCGGGGGPNIFGGGTLTQGINYLKSFATKSDDCITDLKAIGLTQASVNNFAATVKMVNALQNPTLRDRMGGADFAPIPNAPVPTIAYNSLNYWQTSFGDLLGTLTHEYAHLANPGPSGEDTALQSALGIKVNKDDTRNISTKLGKDCFNGVQPPKP